ncbi:MAG: hypothetical protein OEV59_01115 [Deltaproteobacteria bacterium]|nr:hypothetical protein [Deltaproteobacteria bacterium]
MTETNDDIETLREGIRGRLRLLREQGVTHIPFAAAPKEAAAPVKEAPKAASEAPKAAAKAAPSSGIGAEIAACSACALRRRLYQPFAGKSVEGAVWFVTFAPTEAGAIKWHVTDGAELATFRKMIEAMRLDETKVIFKSVLRCPLPKDRDVAKDEVDQCMGFLKREAKALKPRAIIIFGDKAANAVSGLDKGVALLRAEPFEFHGVKVFATRHPSEFASNKNSKAEAWEDLQKAMDYLGIPREKK